MFERSLIMTNDDIQNEVSGPKIIETNLYQVF